MGMNRVSSKFFVAKAKPRLAAPIATINLITCNCTLNNIKYS
jgi:hypothetical protein